MAEITDVNWGAIARTGKTYKTKPRNETPPWGQTNDELRMQY